MTTQAYKIHLSIVGIIISLWNNVMLTSSNVLQTMVAVTSCCQAVLLPMALVIINELKKEISRKIKGEMCSPV